MNLTILSFVSNIALVAAIVFFQFRRGSSQVSAEVINTYKLRVEQLSEDNKTLSKNQHENTSKIGRLEGILEEKNKELTRVQDILKDRNPETQKFMQYLTDVAQQSQKYMERDDKRSDQLGEIFTEIRDSMRAINQHMADHTAFMEAERNGRPFVQRRANEIQSPETANEAMPA